MFKSFLLAILPAIALARGDNDGSSSANAREVELFSGDRGVLTLYTYNKEGDGEDEFHGDLEIVDLGGDGSSNQTADNYVTHFIEFGFCF